MIARLEERCTTYPPSAVLAAVVALTAAILALLPGVAEAQEQQQPQQQQQQQQGAAAPATAPAARSAVVAPGDSLWSICQERLGPSASAQQVALDVRRIHDINRNLIGDDPGLIFPGQRLALPPPAGAPAAPADPEAPADRASAPAAPAARTAAGASGPSSAPVQRLKQAAQAHSQALQEQLEETAGGGAPKQAARPAPEPIALPALPEAGAVPEARSLPSRAVPGEGPDVPDDERRRLLGLGIVALTLVLAGLMAWRLPMRRDVAGDAEAWGLYPGYYHHHGEDRHDRQDADLPVGDKPRLATTTDPARRREPARRHEPAKRREPGRNGAKGSPRKGMAVAHNPSVRRALRRAPRGAPTTPPGRPPRDRPVGARGPSRSAVVRRHPARRRAAGLARGRNR